jgi:hypothetical protein
MDSFLGHLVPIFGIVFAFGAPTAVIIVIAILRHRQRMELIRQGINPDQGILPGYPKQKSLLWGLLLLGIGIAAIASVIWSGDHNLMTFGIIFTGAGIASLVYWKLTAPERERARKLFEERYAAGEFEPQPPARKKQEETLTPAE